MLPSTFFPITYNPSDWIDPYDTLTLEDADLRYNRKYGINYASDLYITGNLYKGGSLLDFSLISGAVAGTPQNGKVLSLNSSGQMNGSLSLTGSLTAASLSISGNLTIGSTILLETDLLKINGITDGSATASKALVLNSSGRIRFGLGNVSTNSIQFYGGTQYKETYAIFRDSDDAGLTIGSDSATIQRASPALTVASLYSRTGTVGSSSGGTTNMLKLRWQQFETTVIADDVFTCDQFLGVYGNTPAWLASGSNNYWQYQTNMPMLNIACNSSSTSTWAASNNIMMTQDARYLLNTDTPSSSYQLTLNGTSTYNGIYLTGASTMLQLFNPYSTNTGRTSIVMGGTNFSSWEVSIGGTAHATAPSSMYWYCGTYRMVLTNDGQLGLGGVTSPVCTLDVGTSSTVTTTTNIAVNTYYYTISNNTYTNMGGGPVTVNICGRFRGNVWIQDKIIATSDRRIKTDIKTLDFTLEHFKQIRPVSYRMKNEDKIKLGVIAQELGPICAEALLLMPNENMKKETDDDIEGVQFGVDYTAISMMNTVAIKKLLGRIEELENTVTTLINNSFLP